MLRAYIHRNGKIPTAIHPFEKSAMATQLIEPKKAGFWFYRFVSIGYNNSIAPILSAISAYILLWSSAKK